MQYSRAGTVAVLLAAEAFIAGGILTQAAGMPLHPQRVAPGPAQTFDAGTEPHVVVDDRDSRIAVSISSDGRVHVSDQSTTEGLVWGSGRRAPLQISRTADGVSVRREQTGGVHVAIFGLQRERVAIEVPAGAILDVQGCDGADISGLRAESLAVNCQDGSLRVSDITVRSGSLKTADGSIRVGLAAGDLTVHASTADGSLRFDGQRVHSGGDGAEGTFEQGSGSGRLEVATQDGSIRITTKGVQ